MSIREKPILRSLATNVVRLVTRQLTVGQNFRITARREITQEVMTVITPQTVTKVTNRPSRRNRKAKVVHMVHREMLRQTILTVLSKCCLALQ